MAVYDKRRRGRGRGAWSLVELKLAELAKSGMGRAARVLSVCSNVLQVEQGVRGGKVLV